MALSKFSIHAARDSLDPFLEDPAGSAYTLEYKLHPSRLSPCFLQSQQKTKLVVCLKSLLVASPIFFEKPPLIVCRRLPVPENKTNRQPSKSELYLKRRKENIVNIWVASVIEHSRRTVQSGAVAVHNIFDLTVSIFKRACDSPSMTICPDLYFEHSVVP